jgi:hypothetical protein
MVFLTKEEALTAERFHDEDRLCNDKRGPLVWRRNGKTQTWKRDPERFRIPVKHGMYDYGDLTNLSIGYHTEENCPFLKEQAEINKEGATASV